MEQLCLHTLSALTFRLAASQSNSYEQQDHESGALHWAQADQH